MTHQLLRDPLWRRLVAWAGLCRMLLAATLHPDRWIVHVEIWEDDGVL